MGRSISVYELNLFAVGGLEELVLLVGRVRKWL